MRDGPERVPGLSRFLEDEALLLRRISSAFSRFSLIEREHGLGFEILTHIFSLCVVDLSAQRGGYFNHALSSQCESARFRAPRRTQDCLRAEETLLNIVIPMAGAGSRFSAAGYTEPKPLIPIFGQPMIRRVIENLRPRRAHRFIFICQKSHISAFELNTKLPEWAPGCVVVPVVGLTEGAACTVLAARPLIDSSDELMIANSDQYVDCSIDDYLESMHTRHLDGLIMTMTASDAKWSFVGLNRLNLVTLVVEKQVISDEATVGIYNFARGSDFVTAADQMIANQRRVNGEYYVAPVYNELIQRHAAVGVFNIGKEADGMYGLGTPSDLELFMTLPVGRALREERR